MIIERVYNYFCKNLTLLIVKNKKNIKVDGKLIIKGRSLIDIRESCFLHIKNNVTLNSINKGYHINLHSPVKIFAKKKGSKIIIGNNTRIHGSCIHADNFISIGDNCLIAANCNIIDNHGHDLSFDNVEDRIHTSGEVDKVILEDNVWCGANSIILPGVTIGRGSVIGANSVVSKSIPPMVIAGGNPAKVIRSYKI